MKSHHLAMAPVVEELGRRGHKVVFALPRAEEFDDFFPEGAPGVEVRRMGPSGWSVHNAFTMPDVKNLPYHQTIMQFASLAWGVREQAEKAMLGMLDDFTSYVEVEKPDVVLSQTVSFGIIGKLLSTAGAPPVVSVVTGLPAPAWVIGPMDVVCRYPNIQAPDTLDDLRGSLALRIKNRLTCMAMHGLMTVLFNEMDMALAKAELPPVGSFPQALARSQVQVGYGGPPLMLPMPMPGNMHLIGIVTKRSHQAIESSLLTWLDDASAANVPVLYVSMGTKYEFTGTSGAQVIAALRHAMEVQGVRVLWSLRKSQQKQLAQLLPERGALLRLESFTPQPEVLAHGSVRAFLSHCGFGGVTDSLAAGVPILGYPGFAEQFVNAVRVEEVGAGLRVKPDFSDFAAGLRRVLSEASFAEAARASGSQLRALGGLDRLAEIVEATAQGRSVERPADLVAAMSMDSADPLLRTPQYLETFICWLILLAFGALAAGPLLCCSILCLRTTRLMRRLRSVSAPRLLGRQSAHGKDKSA